MDVEQYLGIGIGLLFLFYFVFGIVLVSDLHIHPRRIAKYWRVRVEQATDQEKIDAGLFVASVLLLADVLIVAAK